MATDELATDSEYQRLLGRISEVYTAGQVRAHQAVNTQITETYWQIGHDIVEFEQGGQSACRLRPIPPLQPQPRSDHPATARVSAAAM